MPTIDETVTGIVSTAHKIEAAWFQEIANSSIVDLVEFLSEELPKKDLKELITE